MKQDGTVHLIRTTDLVAFCRDVFTRAGLAAGDAQASADVLVAADVRGIPSHSVGRLWRYVNGLRSGLMLPNADPVTLLETPTSLVVDARGGMGAAVSVRVMAAVIEKARASGTAFASVRDSNHFGIAGYYAMMALEHDMLGIAMTNTAALGVPTFCAHGNVRHQPPGLRRAGGQGEGLCTRHVHDGRNARKDRSVRAG